jgi:hypothetical protein
MYLKKISPKPVLELHATEFICELSSYLDNFSRRAFEIEFYDKDGHPLLSRKGKITGLPINTKFVENLDPDTLYLNIDALYSSSEVKIMFAEQEKLIFDEIKKRFGLTYYDDTFEIIDDRTFSYRT